MKKIIGIIMIILSLTFGTTLSVFAEDDLTTLMLEPSDGDYIAAIDVPYQSRILFSNDTLVFSPRDDFSVIYTFGTSSRSEATANAGLDSLMLKTMVDSFLSDLGEDYQTGTAVMDELSNGESAAVAHYMTDDYAYSCIAKACDTCYVYLAFTGEIGNYEESDIAMFFSLIESAWEA